MASHPQHDCRWDVRALDAEGRSLGLYPLQTYKRQARAQAQAILKQSPEYAAVQVTDGWGTLEDSPSDRFERCKEQSSDCRKPGCVHSAETDTAKPSYAALRAEAERYYSDPAYRESMPWSEPQR